ncbi:DMT family transporter [Saccharicrinis aurantiacus]|uniref:DMT family transporter n=1 Tax=Saccharicrinis aurantiacus TaxID=1849719 RepID=UPI002492D35A|nr:DMT family transporter [Saccharicrinis aurantiacus]
MSKESIRTYLYVLITMVCWAFSFVWSKVAYESFNPISTIFFRLIISAFVLIAFLKVSKRWVPIQRKHYKVFVSLAFFEPFLYFMGESFGLKLVSSTLAAVIISTIPLITPIFGWLLYKERISPLTIGGLIISFFGVGIMIFENGFELAASLVGILLMFLAVFSTIGYAVTLKKLANVYPPVTIIACQSFIGIFMFLPLFLILDVKTLFEASISSSSVLAIVQLAIFASSIAFIFFTKAIKKLGVTKTNMFINLIPVFTAFFAWLIRGDVIDMQKIIGITIVICGLFISQIKFTKSEA